MAGTVVICFTDIVASTELAARVGDEAFDEVRRRHFEVLARQVDAHGGEVVKSLGDGLMTAFGSASDAVSAAVAMQRAVDAASRTAAHESFEVKMGISAGDATAEDGDWFGVPVTEGARLCSVADPGQILVSEVVRLLAGSRGGHQFRSIGELELKGFPDPVGVAEVAWAPTRAAWAVPLPGALTPDDGELPFSGRDEALVELLVRWQEVAAGEARVVMVAGEPGVGKSRLVAELARTVHADGALVLLGRTDEHIAAPYAPWREALRELARSAPDEVLEHHVAEHGGELARIVPELGRRIDGLRPPVATDPETERLLLFEAVAGLIRRSTAETPVLLVLEDVHWIDRSSLQLLLHLLRSSEPAAVLVVATYRDTEIDRSHPLGAALADLRRIRGTSRLALGGLDGDGVVALLVAAGGHELGDDERTFAETLWRETEGNPLFVGEVIRHLIETGGLVREAGRWRAGAGLEPGDLPEGVREVIGRRLSSLSEATNAVLGVASVVGREFDVTLVADVADQPVDVVFEALEPAERARLIGEVPGRAGRYSFSHALVRSALVEELGTNRRVRLHRAAGLALERTSGPPVDDLAYHFGEAAVLGESARAVRYAMDATEQALSLAAPEAAVAFARRGLAAADLGDLPDTTRTRVTLLLGRALGLAGSLDEARDVVADAFGSAVGGDDVDTAYEAALEYGGVAAAWETYGDERGPTQLRTVLDLLPPDDSALRAAALARLAEWLIAAPGDTGARAARDAYDMAVRVGDPAGHSTAARIVAVTLRNIDPPAQLVLLRESRSLTSGIAASLETTWVADAQLALGDIAGADTTVEEGHAVFEANGLRTLGYLRDTWQTTRALIEGRFADIPDLIARLDSYPPDNVLPRVFSALGRTLFSYLQGDWTAAAAGWDKGLTASPALIAPYLTYGHLVMDEPEVRAEWERWHGAIEPLLPTWARYASVAFMAQYLRRLDEREPSAALRREFAGQSGYYVTNSTNWFHGPWDTTLGVLATTAGDLDDAVRSLTRAVDQCDQIASPTWGAVARIELATTARMRNAPGDDALAAATAADARRLTEHVGMPGWTERIDRLEAGDPQAWR